MGAQYLTGRSKNTVLRVELNADAVPWTFQADAPCIQAEVHIIVKEGLSGRSGI